MKANGKGQTYGFYVTDATLSPILDLTSCQKLGLFKKLDMVDHKESLTSLIKDMIAKEFEDMFKGLGCFENAYYIELNVMQYQYVSLQGELLLYSMSH